MAGFVGIVAEREGRDDVRERGEDARHDIEAKVAAVAKIIGFIRNGVNLNYYDDKALARAVTPFMVETIRKQIAIGGRSDRAVILGIGANLKFLTELNAEHGFFRELIPLEHPRWIMQYRRRRLDEYVEKYREALSS